MPKAEKKNVKSKKEKTSILKKIDLKNIKFLDTSKKSEIKLKNLEDQLEKVQEERQAEQFSQFLRPINTETGISSSLSINDTSEDSFRVRRVQFENEEKKEDDSFKYETVKKEYNEMRKGTDYRNVTPEVIASSRAGFMLGSEVGENMRIESVHLEKARKIRHIRPDAPNDSSNDDSIFGSTYQTSYDIQNKNESPLESEKKKYKIH